MPPQTSSTGLREDVFWLFRAFDDARDWIQRMPSAALSMILTGVLMGRLGFAPGVTGAVSALGLVTVASEVVFRFIFNTTKNLEEELSRKEKSFATVAFIALGVIMQFLLVEGAINAPVVTVIQFAVGLGIVGIAGALHNRTYTLVKRGGGNISARIGLSIVVTVGGIMLILLLTPMVLEEFGKGAWNEWLKNPPAEAVNKTKNLTGIDNASVS